MRAHGRGVRRRLDAGRGLGLLAVLVVVAATGACGAGNDDQSVTVASVSAAASTSPVAPSTTVPVSTRPPTTAAPTSSTSSTTVPDATGGMPADQEARDTNWESNAADYRGEDGKKIGFSCPAHGAVSSVWGSGPYTDDSSVCTAAVHAGLISLAKGGRVVIRIGGGQAGFMSTERNGVTTGDYESWPGSYTFPNAPTG